MTGIDETELGTDDASAALRALAADLVIELGAAKAAEILQLAGVQQETTGQEYAARPRDPYGQWQPPPPGPQAGWHHTLRAQHNRQHLLGQDRFMSEMYGRSPGPGRQAAAEAHWGRQSPQEGSQGTGIPPEGPPGGQQQAGDVSRDAAGLPLPGGNVGGPADGGGIDAQVIPPRDPAAAPRRPARRSRMPQYGRRVRGRR